MTHTCKINHSFNNSDIVQNVMLDRGQNFMETFFGARATLKVQLREDFVKANKINK